MLQNTHDQPKGASSACMSRLAEHIPHASSVVCSTAILSLCGSCAEMPCAEMPCAETPKLKPSCMTAALCSASVLSLYGHVQGHPSPPHHSLPRISAGPRQQPIQPRSPHAAWGHCGLHGMPAAALGIWGVLVCRKQRRRQGVQCAPGPLPVPAGPLLCRILQRV